ncbi:Glutathione S-transferase, N-terminal domain [Peptoniphilus asaccharolyticus DSM 20463]|uniref:Glutathione S-transferase, N-terminal domain n=1 Tax=Peptoniphilus asaccharolyticus DSM 20463 TaxID=573058 RepID=A0A1W1V9L0_PEPAS|nr:glutathione S-transferase N-terminal domain-containing protein [Peptoniphilus asaccharolyticus]MBL7575781.1 glutathione S-transferase N-terminal domain-containing protein [Peptoniphilus asaccharolyticus]CRH93949.1 Glutaredoxin-3 [Chlamydia trachomatis]SMB89963.1 Glutathione S-transferase, N-terminal domain [Peptoniphilus asaccharolyticus DSM 20463]
MKNLKLYYKPTCPYCVKVLNYMGENNIETIELLNVDEIDGLRAELNERGGKTQVPALDIDGKIMYESDDIVEYLKANF